MPRYYLGVDVGSVSTDIAVLDSSMKIVDKIYLRTKGQPLKVISEGINQLQDKYDNSEIGAVGTTGSGRNLAGVILGADVIKNEITTHAVAAVHMIPDVKTVLEIGGQDSKIIIIRDGVAVDFAMNSVCAAGTGSFLDQQAARLEIPIEEFGEYALRAEAPVRIAGRCSVFAESDMIHKQQLGHDLPEIIAGLSAAMVRNYLNNLAKGKDIKGPIIFQGGVAANVGIKKAFEDELGIDVIVPENYNVMGAVGAAILAREEIARLKRKKTSFKGFEITDFNFKTTSFECDGCPNCCEIVNIYQDSQLIARWGAKCPRWEAV
ncbi:2-hydroxyglutaryl-CoA dehydratase [Iocasia frigidifontis]|uniref:2-hydroxyglutaryl-CoA dehydratase n=1 Tax=Iocasia fonsfrigidae TaxID=2682810 RepID=A0A8A7KHY8_9FIRM|nr:acyl-CoA dehydratase activase [Iocasia fonsfrigidae]QTL98477.1 2-hydroxyglutaryl-CoA dehydratase [Iocasia fonsfrigidae]